MDTDFLLIKSMKSGDEIAMENFVRRYYAKIFSYCQYHIPDKEYAEDITQETFLHFFKSLSNYRHYGKALNYLYKIAGNLCKDFCRKKVEWLPLNNTETEEDQLERIEVKIDVNRMLSKLPQKYKEVIILYYFQGVDLKEIAKIQNIGLPLVKYRIREAKKRLSIMVGEEVFL